jgi:hypothetical protein
MTETCSECRWWKRNTPAQDEDSEFMELLRQKIPERSLTHGECRFRAPHTVDPHKKFPIMAEDDFCGDFKLRQNDQNG